MFTKRLKQIALSLMALASTAAMTAAVVQFTAISNNEWKATSTSGCSAGSTVTLDGAVITFGSPDDASTSWSWNSNNKGIIPSQMPNTDGTAATLITSFSETTPFGTLPTRGCFFKIEPTKAGTITIGGKASTNSAQPLVFVTATKEDPTTIIAASVTAWNSSVYTWSYDVDADHVYYFFQQAYPNQLSGYRFTLQSFKFEEKAEEPARKITVWTIGDSTMAKKSGADTERGWGMYFWYFINPDLVDVSNNGVNGRSTSSYINEGRWAGIVSQIQAGDYVLIQFGHNDQHPDYRYNDPQTTYKQNLRTFINDSRDKGANPVLLTSVARRAFGSDGNIFDEHGPWVQAMKEVGEELNVPLIDMNTLSLQYENIAGIVGSRDLHEYYPGTEIDNTHFGAAGAYITARCVAEQIALNSDINIPLLEGTPSFKVNGTYSSTIEYVQKTFKSFYPAETPASTLEGLNAQVRTLRHAQRQALSNATQTTDATFALVNPNMAEGLSWYTYAGAYLPMAWHFDVDASDDVTRDVAVSEEGFNYLSITATTINSIDAYQTVSDLPDGTYEVTAKVYSIIGNEGGSVSLYATSGQNQIATTATSTAEWETLSLRCSVDNGELQLGIRTTEGWNARLADVHLYYYIEGDTPTPTPAPATPITIVTEPTDGVFTIATSTIAAPIVYDAANDHTVVGLVANCVASDIAAITGQKPTVATSSVLGAFPAEEVILAGTVGQSTLIDGLIANGSLDASAINGKWESFTLQVIDNPAAGISRALVIAGSTPRGTAYGLFELSRLMGVSPYIYWADVLPEQRSALYATPGTITSAEPSVKFRGFFINDEDWGMQPWAAKMMDPDVIGPGGSVTGNMGPNTYAKLFELLLRLRGNIVWPAMHEVTTAFWKIADNPAVARQWGIVLGSTHAEPCLRNNVGEWTQNANHFNWATNKSGVLDYWRTRVQESVGQDAMYTLGMRGIHDSGMVGYSTTAEKVAAYADIIAEQRNLLQQYINPDVTQVPQTFIPYKEVLDAYNAGLEVPDDVTLTWVDDNFGFIRQMPTEAEQRRSGSHGIYYHLSYFGKPRDWLWLSTLSPSTISYELTRGYQQGIQRLWMINVGDLKPAEAELEFCMDLAWDINSWEPTKAASWNRHWAAETFGEAVADDVAAIKLEYYRLAANGKPEHVYDVNYTNGEIDQRIEAYENLVANMEAVKGSIPANKQDAFYQLIEYPVRCACLMNVKILRARQSFTEASAGRRTTALQYAADAQAAYAEIQTLTNKYNKEIAGGKWDGMMDANPNPTYNGNADMFGAPVVATEADITPYETNLSEGAHVSIAANKYTAASSSVKAIYGLGGTEAAVCVWPMNLNSYANAADAPYVDYSIPVKAGDNTITVRCLPTFPLHDGGSLRYAIQYLTTGGNATTFSIATYAGASVWNANVERGWATGKTHTYTATADGTLDVRIYLMDPGLAITEITVDQPGDDSLTDQYLTNPDFELSAEGVVNEGGATVRGVPYGWSTNKEFSGNSKGINNGSATNLHGDNSCWFWNKPMPSEFELYQTIKNLPAGRYRITCRLGCATGCLGTLRLFAGQDVQYFGKESDYASAALTKGERNTYAGLTPTSNYNTLQNMYVDFQINEQRDINIGIRTGNLKADGTEDTSGETGCFRVDYFQLYYIGEVVPTYDVTFRLGAEGGESYAGFVPLFDADFEQTEGVTAYVATSEHNGIVTLTEVSAVPTGTPVILRGTQGETVTISVHDGSAAEAPAVNFLRAAQDTEIAATDPRYVLTYQSSQWLFAHYSGILPVGKVYLELPATANEVKGFRFDDATRIEGIANDESRMTNDECAGAVYNLAGQRIAAPQRGINIQNNKKYIVK